jgi:hypothetical protein
MAVSRLTYIPGFSVKYFVKVFRLIMQYSILDDFPLCFSAIVLKLPISLLEVCKKI